MWNKYDGVMMDGVKRGKGRIIYSNGDCFEGEFRDDKVIHLYIYINSLG
jgi:hypothetical protein